MLCTCWELNLVKLAIVVGACSCSNKCDAFFFPAAGRSSAEVGLSFSAMASSTETPLTVRGTSTGKGAVRCFSSPFGELKDGSKVTRIDLTILSERDSSVASTATGGEGAEASSSAASEPSSSVLFKVSLLDYGATILSVQAPDRDGVLEEITLQHDTLKAIANEGGLGSGAYNGAVCGRVANRIANGKFNLNDEEYTLAVNNGVNSLHGGLKGFDKVVWDMAMLDDGVKFTYVCNDGEEGYPGKVYAAVTYRIATGESERSFKLLTKYTAQLVDNGDGDGDMRATPINLTNHAYWNLSGEYKRKVHGLIMQLGCSRYLPVDDNQIPTGELAEVTGTPFDFRFDLPKRRFLKEAVDTIDGGGQPGLDHCFVVDSAVTIADDESEKEKEGAADGANAVAVGEKRKRDENEKGQSGGKTVDDDSDWEAGKLMVRLEDPISGRVLELRGTQPGLQVYTTNWLPASSTALATSDSGGDGGGSGGDTVDSSVGSKDHPHTQHNGVALETQHFPNAINQEEWAESVILRPNDVYQHSSCHTFSTLS